MKDNLMSRSFSRSLPKAASLSLLKQPHRAERLRAESLPRRPVKLLLHLRAATLAGAGGRPGNARPPAHKEALRDLRLRAAREENEARCRSV